MADEIIAHLDALVAREQRDRNAWAQFYADDPKTPDRVLILDRRIEVLRDALDFARGEG